MNTLSQIIANTPKWVFVLFVVPIANSLLYGVYSGAFAGRALRLMKLVKPS